MQAPLSQPGGLGPAVAVSHPPGSESPRATAAARWSVRLLGAVEAYGAGQHITRWPSRAVAALLARLALSPGHAHPREELIELLWPGVALDVGRNRLRQALSSLKGLLEPPAPQRQPVIDADRHAVRVAPDALHCDARDLARRLLRGEPLDEGAHELGELMPGYYDEWIVEERRRLAGLIERAALGTPSGSRAATSASAPGASPAPAASAAPASGAGAGDASSVLPSYLTRNFGSELSAARLRALVALQRLVTVHGPGGSGKTRLAVEVARGLARERTFEALAPPGAVPFERVVFVPVLACTSAGEVLHAVARALGLMAAHDARALIVAHLENRRVLLVLDNAEQLAPDADEAVGSLLAALESLHVLVTSRRLLGLDGEVTFELEGLTLPPPDAPLEVLAANPAAALFVDRARAVRSDFRLGARHGEAIAALVRLLGGMPLAIELAASRVRTLSPAELLERLSQGAGSPMLDLLARPRRSASTDARHASMRHMVEWSWRQLTSAQAALLADLSVLAAPAPLAAVARVAGLAPEAAIEALSSLEALSLVQAVHDEAGGARHALLQPVREYAAAQLQGEAARSARRRLREWLLEEALSQPGAATAMAGEALHVHAALMSAVHDGEENAALKLAASMRVYWETDVLPLPAMEALEACVARSSDTDLKGEVLEILAQARLSAGFRAEARAHIEAALALPLDDRRRSLVIARAAWVRYGSGELEADLDAMIDEAIALAERGGADVALAFALRLKSVMASNLRLDFAASDAYSARAQAIWERLGNSRMAWGRLRDRATMWAWMGRNEEAAPVLRESERAALADADWVGAMISTRQLGRVLIRMRLWADAATALRRTVRLAWERRYMIELTVGLLHLPDALVHDPASLERAARLHAFAEAHWRRLFGPLNRIEQRELRCTRRLLRLRLGAVRAEALRLQGLAWTLPRAVAEALGEAPAG